MTEPESESIAPPSLMMLPFEARAVVEVAAAALSLTVLGRTPSGDGHPVLVIPGWLGGDLSTLFLRYFLGNRGYRAHAWGLGINTYPTQDVIRGLDRRLQVLSARYRRKVSLIGWSLGGIYARELARRQVDIVRQVITLASPFRDPGASTVARFYRAVYPMPSFANNMQDLRRPLAVPSTSLYSKSDGMVAWRSCIDDPGIGRENISVHASHWGMGYHPAALKVILDRLTQPEGHWRPYVPTYVDKFLGLAWS